jgi:carbon monoxide dehydrogenase subunit G
MRMFRRIVLIVVAIVVVLIAIGYLLPQRVAVARSIDIAAPPSVVFPLVADLRNVGEWSPWLGIDPNIRVTFSGKEIGVGQVMSWSSDDARVGSGSQAITEYAPDSRVVTALDFGPQGRAVATTTVDPAGEGARVTWGFDTDLGMNPVARYFGLALEGMIAPDFERGLAKLKEVAEAEAVAAPAPREPDTQAPDPPLAPDTSTPGNAATPDSTTPTP